MNKEQIQQELEQFLNESYFEFNIQDISCTTYSRWQFVSLMKQCFNLGLEVAANNAEADYNMVGSWDIQKMGDIECYVLKESILKLKL